MFVYIYTTRFVLHFIITLKSIEKAGKFVKKNHLERASTEGLFAFLIKKHQRVDLYKSNLSQSASFSTTTTRQATTMMMNIP